MMTRLMCMYDADVSGITGLWQYNGAEAIGTRSRSGHVTNGTYE